ncbi:hypothetical protein [Embleya sp. AB8]|uniref:hypothetical protein n=1 Tax=Embleya sp. AB8 TaxID=3156304 RepID=UPI003C7919A4
MYRSRTAAAVTAVALGWSALTGCAGPSDALKSNLDRDAGALVRESAGLFRGADDIRIVGDQLVLSSKGVNYDSTKRVDYDLCVRGGRDYRGTFDVSGRTAEAILVGDKSYLKGNAGFWEWGGTEGLSPATTTRPLIDRYATRAYDSTDPLHTLGSIFGPSLVGYRKDEPVTVDGRTLIPLVHTGEDENGNGDVGTRTVYVQAYGKPYPVKVTTRGRRPQTAKLTTSGHPCAPVAPPADTVVDWKRPRK